MACRVSFYHRDFSEMEFTDTNTLAIGEIPFELGLKTVIVCTCKMVGLRSRGNITIIDKKGALVKLNINK